MSKARMYEFAGIIAAVTVMYGIYKYFGLPFYMHVAMSAAIGITGHLIAKKLESRNE